jgi:hypothetical protein
VAFNDHVREEHRLQTDVRPQPFLGSEDAPIVLLNLNPGFAECDYLDFEDSYTLEVWRKNLLHEPLVYPFYSLDPKLSHTGGARWWRKKLKEPIQIAGEQVVANTFLCIEYFPYPSRKFKAMRSLLESQRYSFDLANQAIDRNAVIVVMRAQDRWERAVPRLVGYSRLFTLNSSQSGAISRKNCIDGFPVIESILRNEDTDDRALLL